MHYGLLWHFTGLYRTLPGCNRGSSATKERWGFSFCSCTVQYLPLRAVCQLAWARAITTQLFAEAEFAPFIAVSESACFTKLIQSIWVKGLSSIIYKDCRLLSRCLPQASTEHYTWKVSNGYCKCVCVTSEAGWNAQLLPSVSGASLCWANRL